MAKEYDNNNSGVLFKNERKEKNSQPDLKGSAEINGVQYWVSAWKRESQKDGSKFFSLSFTPKESNEDLPEGEYDSFDL